MAFKDRLRLLRQERALTQQELGHILNLSKANISKFETGKLQPNLDHLITLVQYFDVPAEYLLGISDDRKDLNFPVDVKNAGEEKDPFKQKITSVLANEYSETEKDIISRCLTYGLRQIDALRNERRAYSC